MEADFRETSSIREPPFPAKAANGRGGPRLFRQGLVSRSDAPVGAQARLSKRPLPLVQAGSPSTKMKWRSLAIRPGFSARNSSLPAGRHGHLGTVVVRKVPCSGVGLLGE